MTDLGAIHKQHAIGMRLLTMEVLRRMEDEIEKGNVSVSNLGTCPNPRTLRRALKRRTPNVSTVFELCLALMIYYEDLAVKLVNYVRQPTAYEQHLTASAKRISLHVYKTLLPEGSGIVSDPNTSCPA